MAMATAMKNSNNNNTAYLSWIGLVVSLSVTSVLYIGNYDLWAHQQEKSSVLIYLYIFTRLKGRRKVFITICRRCRHRCAVKKLTSQQPDFKFYPVTQQHEQVKCVVISHQQVACEWNWIDGNCADSLQNDCSYPLTTVSICCPI